jgi:hypothetical protein
VGLRERIRRFFYSDDEIVKFADGLREEEAEMWRELLQNNGIPAMVKNVGGGLGYHYGRAGMFTADYALYVRSSDVAGAREVLGPLP